MRLIDADALHNVLRKKPRWIVRNGDKHNEGYTYDQVHFAIDDMPTIEDLTPTTHLIKYWAERKHGYGVEHIPHCKCANCGVEYPPRIAQNIKYCAYCGARVVKERDK